MAKVPARAGPPKPVNPATSTVLAAVTRDGYIIIVQASEIKNGTSPRDFSPNLQEISVEHDPGNPPQVHPKTPFYIPMVDILTYNGRQKGNHAMTTSNPAEQINSTFTSLQTDLRSLQGKVHMSDARDALEDLDTKIKGLPQAVNVLRARKYAFEAALEGQAQDMIQRWAGLRPSVDLFIEQQATQLEIAIRPIEARMTYLSGQMGNPDFALGIAKEIETEISNLQDKISGATSTASGMYDQLAAQFNQVNEHINDLNYTLDQLDQACFKLTAAESGIMAIKATWTRDGKEDRDDPQGVLYLTDQRLLFEQKQEVATKKVLFITTEKKLVQQLLWEVPIALVSDVKGSKQGLFKNEDFLALTFATGAVVKSAQLHIFGQDFQKWISLINRACIHEFDKDRVIQIDQAEVEKVKTAPTLCPSCGGNLPKVILRGQDNLTCEYCGFTVRL